MIPVIKFTGIFNRKTKTPDYTPRQLIFKVVQVILSAFVFDLASCRIITYEMQVTYQMAPQAAYDPYFVYLYGLTGFFIANAFWKLLELYWWGKSQCEGREKYLHRPIKEQNQMAWKAR